MSLLTELFKRCACCQGKGYVPIPHDQGEYHHPCDHCNGDGFRLRYKYHKEVKKELGME